ncbi:MAG: hypothetical protein KGI50_04180 [Patescibacteria group bacterium]|nr:hypothetical protein [Patescibacteria group bacterium]MDE2438516.1 hypothetical protein [Patescibacteria group bacterium]
MSKREFLIRLGITAVILALPVFYITRLVHDKLYGSVANNIVYHPKIAPSVMREGHVPLLPQDKDFEVANLDQFFDRSYDVVTIQNDGSFLLLCGKQGDLYRVGKYDLQKYQSMKYIVRCEVAHHDIVIVFAKLPWPLILLFAVFVTFVTGMILYLVWSKYVWSEW